MWLICGAGLDSGAADEFPPIGVGEAQAQLREMEQVMETRFRHMAGRDAFAAANGAVSNYSAWSQTKERSFREWHGRLDEQLGEIRRQESELRTLDAGLNAGKPRAGDLAALNAYNARVRQRNQLVDEVDARNRAYGTALESYSEAVRKFNKESEGQRGKVEGEARAVARRLNEQQTWLMNRSDADFYRRVNALNARLMRTSRRDVTGKRLECMEAAAALREELGKLAAGAERERTNGLIIVEAWLVGRVKTRMIVDTGASTVTISSAVASMLDLTNQVGEEVESTLAGGMVIKGRKVVLPSVDVHGQRVEGVEAIVIPESGCGVDGLLGHSFLDHFAYRFDKSQNPPVKLGPKGSGEGGQGGP